MSRSPFGRLFQDLDEKASARRADTYDMINVRPGSKVSAMIELLAELREVPVSSMLTDNLSDKLAQFAASDKRYASAVLDAAEATLKDDGGIPPDSALGRLVNRGLLQIETDNPLLRALEKFPLFNSKTSGSAVQEDDQ